jgi:uncharacterized protein YdhG (YjbR/CyaY superfamily)
MNTNQTAPKTIDEYIAAFPNDVQEILEKIRVTIKGAVPDAEETISYTMPTFTLNGHYLIYFAAYKKHIGMYPIPTGDSAFNAELSPYIAGKGTLKFPFDQPIPFDLISKMVKLQAQENAGRVVAKGKKK